MMKYESTRSGKNGGEFSFEEVLLGGYAPDGGLFMPVQIPKVDLSVLRSSWAKLPYPTLVFEICRLFISAEEVAHEVLSNIIESSLSPKFISTRKLSHNCVVLELFHGKTLAFKDLAMTVTARLLDYFLQKRGKRLNILVSTSGDTGAAAIEALRASANMDVFVMYPLGRVTEIQELQMTSAAASADNVHLYALSGTSDDGDEVMKALFQDKEFATKNSLSNVNSINWCRILVQIAHHFYGYFQACPNCDEIVEIVCPTGAAGNLAAGCLANAMGLPIKLIASVNENDFLHRMITDGILASGIVHHTLASAMDIQVPYNVERILHVLSKGDTHFAENSAHDLAMGKSVPLSQHLQAQVTKLFGSFKCSDSMIMETMKRCWDEEKYVICPHTATAVAYHYSSSPAITPSSPVGCTGRGELNISWRVCLATASYLKFPEALERAAVPAPEGDFFKTLREAKQNVIRLPNKQDWLPTLRTALQAVTTKHSAKIVT